MIRARSAKASKLVATFAALTLVGCLQPARQRAEKDETIGRASNAGLEIRVTDGLAAVREFDAEHVRLWQSAPLVEFTMARQQPGTVEVELHNSLPGSSLTRRSGARVAITEVERPLPTRVRYAIEWRQAGEVELHCRPPSIATQPFRFALMSDVQEAIDDVQDIFSMINEEQGVEFLLGAGDLTQRGSHTELRRFERELEELDVPYYTTLGNHELGSDPPPFQDRMGRASFSFEYRGARFTLLDSASATIDPLVLSNLDEWLDAARDQVHMVAMHIPPIDPIGVRNGSFASRNEANDLLARLLRGGVDLTLYGHIHSYYRFSNGGIAARISGGGGAIPERFDGIGRHFLAIDVDPIEQTFESKVVRVD
jgi:predicted phosphodiesterase